MKPSLKTLLQSPDVTYALEAHNALSARIAQQAGFQVIWASGLTLSASLGHRDCNEISWTNVCDQIEFMVDATEVPILVDGDTGFGNFNNVRELVRKLSKYGAAGVCLEDKLFPKTNSFISRNQHLTSIAEFCGKIKAAKDSQLFSDFCLVARTEAFIAGLGLDEALERAWAYAASGADAILVHSKGATIEEIAAFCGEWDYNTPLVIVPTTYAHTPESLFKNLRISLVIWANHLLRASMKAMNETARRIFKESSVRGILDEIPSVNDIFTLVDEDELKEAEKRYSMNDIALYTKQ